MDSDYSLDAATLLKAAEIHFKYGYLEEALRLANMAYQIYPNSDGIDKLLTAYSIHVSAMRRRWNGEADWYGVLGISEGSSSVDIEIIKKSYKGLALLVHPDKNSCIAADGAFKLISNAWELLSDPSLREGYDARSTPPPPPPPPSCYGLGTSFRPDWDFLNNLIMRGPERKSSSDSSLSTR